MYNIWLNDSESRREEKFLTIMCRIILKYKFLFGGYCFLLIGCKDTPSVSAPTRDQHKNTPSCTFDDPTTSSSSLTAARPTTPLPKNSSTARLSTASAPSTPLLPSDTPSTPPMAARPTTLPLPPSPSTARPSTTSAPSTPLPSDTPSTPPMAARPTTPPLPPSPSTARPSTTSAPFTPLPSDTPSTPPMAARPTTPPLPPSPSTARLSTASAPPARLRNPPTTNDAIPPTPTSAPELKQSLDGLAEIATRLRDATECTTQDIENAIDGMAALQQCLASNSVHLSSEEITQIRVMNAVLVFCYAAKTMVTAADTSDRPTLAYQAASKALQQLFTTKEDKDILAQLQQDSSSSPNKLKLFIDNSEPPIDLTAADPTAALDDDVQKIKNQLNEIMIDREFMPKGLGKYLEDFSQNLYNLT